MQALQKRMLTAFNDRKVRNHRYSLRAFAREIGISHSTASRILRGELLLTLPKTKQVATRLKLFDDDLEEVLREARLRSAPDEITRDLIHKNSADRDPVHLIDLELLEGLPLFKIIQALEIIELYPEGATFPILAKNISLQESELEALLIHLNRLGLITKSGDRYQRTIHRWKITSKIHQKEIKNCHREGLKAANQALLTYAPGERYSATDFVALDPALQADFTALCDDFLQKAHELGKRSRHPDRVTLITLNAFPWIKKENL